MSICDYPAAQDASNIYIRLSRPESVFSPAVYTTREKAGSCRPPPSKKVYSVHQEMEQPQVWHRRPYICALHLVLGSGRATRVSPERTHQPQWCSESDLYPFKRLGSPVILLLLLLICVHVIAVHLQVIFRGGRRHQRRVVRHRFKVRFGENH
ncbi:hypothetical protein E2C01_013642 [Portunus trituberculatus]|uniref:Uncharacterized protein n=1 Tax=Portunus trituberculatus TaxID=210409 RepID=A0A5B7DHQ1_PORTR|nr:hypothetical protein [Portunus trituberculatus]